MNQLDGKFYKPRHVPHFDQDLRIQFITYKLKLKILNLSSTKFATAIVDSWQYHSRVRYDLLSWVVMPDHVHVLIKPFQGHNIATIVGSRKSNSAKEINRILNRSGQVWQKDYWDRAIRNSKHLGEIVEYIRYNPIEKGLIGPNDRYPWWGLDYSSLDIFA